MHKNLITNLLLLTIVICGAANAQTFKPAEVIESSVSKNLYERIWPSRIDSGVAELVFIVDKSGQPTNIEVLRSSEVYFDAPAIKTIATYKYKPATVDGRPVDSRQVARVEFDHSKIANMSGFVKPMDAPEGYMSLYNRLRKELNKEEPSHRKAMHTLNKMHRLRYKTFFTAVHTQLARYYLFIKFGSKEQQLDPLLKIMMFENIEWGGNRALDTDTKHTIQLAIIKLMLELGHNADALEKYQEYSGSNSGIESTFSAYIEKVKQLQASDSVVERKVSLPTSGRTFLFLLKNSFVVEALSGRVDDFLLRCDGRFAEFKFQAGAQYDIPVDWGRCHLQLNGEPETVVSILQQ